MSKPIKAEPSLKPQDINSLVWYYEFKGRIEVYVDIPELRRRRMLDSVYNFRVSKRKLHRSLERMA